MTLRPTPAPSPSAWKSTEADAQTYAEAYSSAYVDADDAGPTPTQTAVQITSSVTLEGIVAVVFNADKDGMQAAFAQSIIDSVGGLFEEIIDIQATEQRRRLQATYSPTAAPTSMQDEEEDEEEDGVEISYTGVARVDGTDGEAASAYLLEQSGRNDVSDL